MSVDPDVEQTQQPYSYASDNPVNGTDPSGMDCVGCTGPGGTRPDAYCGQSPDANVCGGGPAWQACVGGSITPGFFTVGLDVCFVSTPHGDGIAVTPSGTFGPGFGVNVHAGGGVSNACRPSDYSGPFGQVGGSTTAILGGYANAFSNIGIPGHGRTIVGENAGVTAGFGAEAGGGGWQTWVFSF